MDLDPGDSGTTLVGTFDVATLDGTAAPGDWTLRAADVAPIDTGTLNSWGITVTHEFPVCQDTLTDLILFVLGYQSDPSGLDVNDDGSVDAADVVDLTGEGP